MTRRTSFVAAVGVAVLALVASRTLPAQAPVPAGTSTGQWPVYHGDNRNQHYSPLSQIDANNFSALQIAWRLKTDNFGTRPEFKLEGTPLMVNEVLYTTAGTRRAVVALDAATGEIRWVHGEPEGARGAAAPRQLSGRGVAYWADGREERIFYVTPGFRLVALNAKTGQRVPGFGTDGAVDLKALAVYGTGQPIDPIAGEIGLHATPAVGGDTVIVGSAFREGHTPKTHNNTKGLVQAFDARTGKRLWTFHTIPRPGEFGSDTWLNDSWAVNGNVGVWNQMAIDEELGMVYLPVETPSSDFYGGHRPGDNLFAESLVALDLKTGRRRWHFQLVHHPLWNMDIATAPILEDLTVNGRAIKAVSVMGKQAMVYVFDRTNGQPVWPMPETPVPAGDVPGETYSKTQPIPSRPAPYDHQGVVPENLIDFTPALRAEALQLMAMYKMGPLFTPPVLSRKEGPVASFRSSGGTNWPGGAFDPETQVLYVPSYTSLVPVGLMPSPGPDFSDIRYVVGNALSGVRYVTGPGEDAGADATRARQTTGTGTGGEGSAGPRPPTPQGLPYLKPPYGRLTAIDLKRGEHVWQIAHGETPDFVRNHPALKEVTLPRTGQSGAVGALVTKTLVVIGEPQATTVAGRPRGAMLRAYDKATGKEVGAVYMPAPQSGSPMTYSVRGRQFIVVAVSGGNYSGEYLAFALPEGGQ
ncbi:MAG: PQQ-binding-like beta-propeller repeat protein [Vicinamibacterales bacterium]